MGRPRGMPAWPTAFRLRGCRRSTTCGSAPGQGRAHPEEGAKHYREARGAPGNPALPGPGSEYSLAPRHPRGKPPPPPAHVGGSSPSPRPRGDSPGAAARSASGAPAPPSSSRSREAAMAARGEGQPPRRIPPPPAGSGGGDRPAPPSAEPAHLSASSRERAGRRLSSPPRLGAPLRACGGVPLFAARPVGPSRPPAAPPGNTRSFASERLRARRRNQSRAALLPVP